MDTRPPGLQEPAADPELADKNDAGSLLLQAEEPRDMSRFAACLEVRGKGEPRPELPPEPDEAKLASKLSSEPLLWEHSKDESEADMLEVI